MSPIGRRHAACVAQLNRILSQKAGKQYLVWPQNPIQLNDHSEPQPDIALLKFRSDCYAAADPIPADVLLIIEVSDTSADYDRNIKLPLYAASGIPEAWLVDLNREVIEVYLQPTGSMYQTIKEYHRGESLSPQFNSALTLKVGDILG